MTGPFSSYPRRGTVLAAALVLSGLLTGIATTLAIAGPTRVAAGIRVFGGRSPARSGSSEAPKLDATLSGIVRGLPQVHAARGLTDLHNLNPAVRFRTSLLTGEPLVLVDAIAHGNPRELLRTLQGLGLEHPAVYSNDIGGWLPVRQLNTAAARPELHALRASMMHTHAGLVTSQGDFAQGSDTVRASHSLTGSGVTVGVLSDSFNCYAVYEQANSGVTEKGSNGYNGYAPNGFTATATTDESTGDLTTSVNVVEEADCLSYGAPDQLPFGDEGRALLQIVHDVAPGAALAFHTGDNSEADFASGIGKLQAAGARVIADDIGYYDEPFFQDGIVAQAIDSAQSAGVAYFAAAGNNGTVSYDNTAPAFTTTTNTLSTAGEMLLNFDPTGASNTTALSINVPTLDPGDFFALVLQWDQPYVTGAPTSGGATSQLELCVTGAAASPIIIGSTASSPGAISCTGLNTPGADPVQLLIIGNPANASGPSTAETIALEIGLGQGSAAPGRIKLAVDGDGLAIAINNGFVPASVPTLQGHPGAAGAMAVGAAPFWNTPSCGVSPAVLEPYSSRGGEPILFDVNGNRLSTAEQRTKPDVVDTDGVYTTFFGTVISQTGFKDSSTVPECADTDSFPSFFGTSAATPHAAGAAALFLQYNASLAPAQIYQALRSTASAMGSTVPNDTSGYGLVQAEQALAALPAPGSTGSSSSSGGSGSSSGSSSSGSSSSGSSSSGSSSSGSSHGGGSFDGLSLLVLAALSASSITGAARRSRPAASTPPQA
jgi:hypothetical protein